MQPSAIPASKPKRGRPRAFDRDEALRAAMLLFWRNGYEGTSMNQLVEAMGITSTSIYAAFGNKDGLFSEAVDLYVRTEGSGTWLALHGPGTARAAVASMLHGAVASFTAADRPSGCLLVLWGAGGNGAAQSVLRPVRARMRDALRGRLRAGQALGEIRPEVDVSAFAALIMTVLNGISVELADGATKEDLDAAISALLADWPA